MAIMKEGFVALDYQRPSESEMLTRSREYYAYMNKRRTVREFSTDPIPDEVIENIIMAASTAPSGAHMQPWRFCVVKDPALRSEIRKAAEQEEKKNYEQRFPEDWLHDLEIFATNHVKEHIDAAPAIIVVFKENYRVVDGERRKNYYVNESVGIAAGMLIAAIHNAGLATLTHTPNPMGFLGEILGRPKNETAILLMPIGYPLEGTRVPNLKRKALDEVMTVY